MSQTSKRPGARDISDLKARLGLKKTGSPPTAPAPPTAGGIVPPPGAPIPGSIPAPPGMAPQTPSPSAATDPFGAMGAAVQQAAAPAQDYVIVNDGKPVESVANANKGARVGKIAVMILAPLVAGVLIGKLSAGANQYNQVIEDAEPIMKDVKKVRSGLTELTAILESGKKGDRFSAGDPELTKKLTALLASGKAKKATKPKEGEEGKEEKKSRSVLAGNDKLVFESSLYHLDWKTASTIYGFYSDLHTLETELRAHLRAAKLESKILDTSKVAVAGFNPMGFGAVLNVPGAEDAAAGSPVTMKVVQLGAPVCAGETRPNPAGCGGKALAGFQHRDDQLSGWKTDVTAPTGEEGEWGGAVVPLVPSKALEQILRGGDATVAEVAYDKRIKSIDALTARLLDTSKSIQKVLGEKADESGKFSFFL